MNILQNENVDKTIVFMYNRRIFSGTLKYLEQ